VTQYSLRPQQPKPSSACPQSSKALEIRATHYENMIRVEFGLPLRTHYGSYRKGSSILPDAQSTIIDKSGNSVYYNTPTQRFRGQVTPTLINDGIRANNGIILNGRYNYYGKR
jgi:hypothetical protein